MLTSYRQKYNPKKPDTKIGLLEIAAQVFFKKNFKNFEMAGKTPEIHEKLPFSAHRGIGIYLGIRISAV